MSLINKVRFELSKRFPSRKLSSSEAEQFAAYQRKLPGVFKLKRGKNKNTTKPVALILCSGYIEEIEIVYTKCFEQIGYRPVVLLIASTPLLRAKFEACGFECLDFSLFDKLVDWSDPFPTQSELARIETYEDIREVQSQEGIMVGMNALATYLRANRSDRLDLKDESQRKEYGKHLEASFAYAKIAVAIVDHLTPAFILMNDRVYSPVAEIFQYALKKGIRAMTRNSSQATGFEIIKSYVSPEAVYTHPHSLSQKSWDIVKSMKWSEDQWTEFDRYMRTAYESGDWFAEVGTQFDKSFFGSNELRAQLAHDPVKPIAVVFSHIFWDGTLSYGIDLFENYYDWFRQVAEVAKKNDSVNWVFKVHPANLVKAKRDGINYESSEEKVIHDVMGETLPKHVKILSSDSEISTYSLFSLMNYCLTVRGTIGIESAAYGVRTLTAGTGRYDRHGFTSDFDTKEAYLNSISALQSIPEMDSNEVELARKFAWAIFKMRHLKIDPLNWTVARDETATQLVELDRTFSSIKELKACNFFMQLKELCDDGNKEDILFING